MTTTEAVPIGLGILAALTALHGRGIVHRDLKPSNVFLTPHGVKLLDFGLARGEAESSLNTVTGITGAGIIVGTPRYMAPEQARGEAADPRSDLFAAGAVLFEMLAGRPAFNGPTLVDILHATLHEQPPALTGSPAVTAVDRVIRRALAKRPGDRPQSAASMAEELGAVTGSTSVETRALAQALTRLVVLPFRVLRPDPESDFLAFSLPDAVSMSLSANDALVVRSSAVASKFAGSGHDLKTLAADADVDRVVMGTLMRAGEELRVSIQLVDAASGTLLASHIVQSRLGDLFHLQDDIARRLVSALSLPLTGRGVHSPAPESMTPDGHAYELYLRANELARTYDGLPRARELYRRCLELDPRFAPAWAQLGRCHRVIGKYISAVPSSEADAAAAFSRALEINPRLTIAHKMYAMLEADTGQAPQGLVRLVGEANRHGNDPELFSGLVHVCRYCGLFDEALAAHEEAKRLDPNVRTSVEQTILMMGDIDRLLTFDPPIIIAGADDGIRVIGLGLAGRLDEAKHKLDEMRLGTPLPIFRAWTDYLLAWLERRPEDMSLASFAGLKIRDDPEAIFQEGWLLCDAGAHQRGIELLRLAVNKGYYVVTTLTERRQFDALRGEPAFEALLGEAMAGRERARAAFRAAGGDRLLGTRQP
jgi:TolB-like protein/tetratricopeptide (TPR) repeat protein